MPAKQKFYAVSNGRHTGIFTSWADCQREVKGFKGAVFKSFLTRAEAEAFLAGGAAAADKENPPPDEHIFFVDGSFDGTDYGWGFAYYRRGELAHTACGVGDNREYAVHRNVAGEVYAAMRAADWAKASNLSAFAIAHDYQGIAEWALGRWKTNTALTKFYAAYMRPFLPQVRFIKVAGHTGVDGNELADRLAKRALAEKAG